MIVKHEDVKVDDVLLMAKGANLTVIKVIGITKSGSLKYTFSDEAEGMNYYGKNLELDCSKHTKTQYAKKGWNGTGDYDSYFWLIHRDA